MLGNDALEPKGSYSHSSPRHDRGSILSDFEAESVSADSTWTIFRVVKASSGAIWKMPPLSESHWPTMQFISPALVIVP